VAGCHSRRDVHQVSQVNGRAQVRLGDGHIPNLFSLLNSPEGSIEVLSGSFQLTTASVMLRAPKILDRSDVFNPYEAMRS